MLDDWLADFHVARAGHLAEDFGGPGLDQIIDPVGSVGGKVGDIRRQIRRGYRGGGDGQINRERSAGDQGAGDLNISGGGDDLNVLHREL